MCRLFKYHCSAHCVYKTEGYFFWDTLLPYILCFMITLTDASITIKSLEAFHPPPQSHLRFFILFDLVSISDHPIKILSAQFFLTDPFIYSNTLLIRPPLIRILRNSDRFRPPEIFRKSFLHRYFGFFVIRTDSDRPTCPN